MSGETKKSAAACLGVIRLDYNYKAVPGDKDHPDSFNYDVTAKLYLVSRLKCVTKGKMSDEVKDRFKESIKWLVREKKVNGVTGDCGFMMNFQSIARNVTKTPIFMSSLCQLPAVTCGHAAKEQIIIMTANGTEKPGAHEKSIQG